MKKTLDAGFTTVRNVGAAYTNITAIKCATSNKIIDGPRIIASTEGVSASGRHANFHSYRAEISNAIEKMWKFVMVLMTV